MNLVAFKTMWEEDSSQLVEEDKREQDGYLWLLYGVQDGRGSTLDYGRHYGLIVVVNPQGEVIAHNIKNITAGDSTPWRPQLQAWWEEHLGEGLVNEAGQRIG